MINKNELLDKIMTSYVARTEGHLQKVNSAIDWLNENVVEWRRDGIVGNVAKYKNVLCMITRNDFRYGAEIDLRPLNREDVISDTGISGSLKTLDF